MKLLLIALLVVSLSVLALAQMGKGGSHNSRCKSRRTTVGIRHLSRKMKQNHYSETMNSLSSISPLLGKKIWFPSVACHSSDGSFKEGFNYDYETNCLLPRDVFWSQDLHRICLLTRETYRETHKITNFNDWNMNIWCSNFPEIEEIWETIARHYEND